MCNEYRFFKCIMFSKLKKNHVYLLITDEVGSNMYMHIALCQAFVRRVLRYQRGNQNM
jgi:hypothetical protein